MNINTKNLVSITEANQNFSRVARLVDENGAAVILKNNVPRYLLVEFSQAESEQQTEDEDVLAVPPYNLSCSRYKFTRSRMRTGTASGAGSREKWVWQCQRPVDFG